MEKEKKRSANGRAKKTGPFRLLLLGLLTLAALFVASCGGATGETGEAGGAGQQEGAEKAVEEEPAELDHPYLGDPGAPVVLVEYADFQ